jgi:hypothetical protein
MENANELDAQPLLTQDVHWYYFEKCAQAQARALVREGVMPQEALYQLRALQDDSLAWLANISISGLAELRERMEHADLREQLKKASAHLSAAGVTDLGSILTEVRHSLESMIQRQKNALRDLHDEYKATLRIELAGAAAGGVAGASMNFLPLVAQIPHVAPIASTIGALYAGGLAAIKETEKMMLERRRLKRKTLLGMLASARGQTEPL